MTSLDIAHLRLHSQHIVGTPCETPADVVGALGAVQAQDYLGSLWAVGLRMRDATEAAIEAAIAARTIIRTWPMRGTLHFVATADVRWMLKLMTPRVIAGSASRLRQLELDDAVLGRGADVFTNALQGGKQLSRPAMYQVLEAAGISTAGQRGIHLLGQLAQAGLLCFGAREGRQPTFALLDEWAPHTRTLERDEALAELALRYFTGHGPATVQDLMWWSGLTAADVRAAVAMVETQLVRETVDGTILWRGPGKPTGESAPAVYLLPGFDEYLVGYKDRGAVVRPGDWQRVNPGSNGMLSPTIMIDGLLAGTWKRTFKKGAVVVAPQPFTPLSAAEQAGLAAAAERYGRFLGMPVVLA